MTRLFFFALIAATALFAKQSLAAGSQDVTFALTRWQKTVESGKVDAIMKLYGKDAVMISTFAQSPLTERREIEGYFKRVVTNPNIKVTFEETHPRVYGDIAIADGRYDLSYEQEGEEVHIPARFTFIFAQRGGEWVIIGHHASQMPDARSKK
ncbi:MAG: nuclear transport factor 2 family protein [Rickettsiales bacterium]|nr:nuclear transport factor 2 family protein [Rickettsiales bacterium]